MNKRFSLERSIATFLAFGMLLVANGPPPAFAQSAAKAKVNQKGKTAILLVSHGSHSKQWREMLFDIEKTVRDEVLADSRIGDIQTAFMEYTEPSIATRLKEFDEAGFTEIVIVPLLLTVSSHSFDDIPVIAGQKKDKMTIETLRLEGTTIYKPKAHLTIAPLLDFPDVLSKNVIRRVQDLSQETACEGVVLVGYGSEPYNEEWEELLEGVAEKVKEETGIDFCNYAWCGHIARYRLEPTEKAIKEVFENKENALVIPILVAVDENFQGRIIGGAVKNMQEEGSIRYRQDAILPDENINNWVIRVSRELAADE